MSHPKNYLSGVHLIAEYNSHALFADESKASTYMKNFSDFYRMGSTQEFMFDISGSTKEFLERVGKHSDNGCPQDLISYLKHARDIGAKWAMFKV